MTARLNAPGGGAAVGRSTAGMVPMAVRAALLLGFRATEVGGGVSDIMEQTTTNWNEECLLSLELCTI